MPSPIPELEVSGTQSVGVGVWSVAVTGFLDADCIFQANGMAHNIEEWVEVGDRSIQSSAEHVGR